MSNNTFPRIVIYRDYDGKIKRGYAWSWYYAMSMFQTMLDPGLLIPTRNGGLKWIPGPRQDILYMFTVKKHHLENAPAY